MSVALVKKAMQEFIVQPSAEVLCISGRWGTGKTFTWNAVLDEAAKDVSSLPLKNYAYVSLYGMKDSAEIMQSVYANTRAIIPAEQRKEEALLGGLTSDDMKRKVKELGAFALGHAKIPFVDGLGGVARAMLANAVTDTLLCFDDFERKADSISIGEVMGAIAQLRDTKGCKVVLILNEDTLSEEDKKEFQKLSEKTLNHTFKYIPAPEDIAKIAFSGEDELSGILRSACTDLRIINIRVAQKIDYFGRRLWSVLKDIDTDVKISVLRSMTLLVYSIASPEGEDAPSLGYLLKRNTTSFMQRGEKPASGDEEKWDTLLTAYGFSHCDDFDLALIEDIKNGFFNDDRVTAEVAKYLADKEATTAQAELTASWKRFHNSFINDEALVADDLSNGLRKHLKYLTPINLSAAVTILVDIGFPDKADQLLEAYMKARETEDVFDRANDAFGDMLNNAKVIAAFDEKAALATKSLPDPADAASRIADSAWSLEDEESLANLTIDELERLFRGTVGNHRNKMIAGCLNFRRVSNATPRQQQITERTVEALMRIGSESPLNAHRLKRFNVLVPTEVVATPR